MHVGACAQHNYELLVAEPVEMASLVYAGGRGESLQGVTEAAMLLAVNFKKRALMAVCTLG